MNTKNFVNAKISRSATSLTATSQTPKILITGTGRCGTTFLIKLFTFLGFDTGYTKDNVEKNIYKNCNSGMERQYTDKHYILKNPKYIYEIEKIMNSKINVKLIIIPIRDYNASAESRNSYKKQNGGLWNATNVNEQLLFYYKIMSNYLYYMTKYEINTLFLDFDKMTTDKRYLFEKLKNILIEKNITFELFNNVFDEVSETSKPKNKLLTQLCPETPPNQEC